MSVSGAKKEEEEEDEEERRKTKDEKLKTLCAPSTLEGASVLPISEKAERLEMPEETELTLRLGT